MASLNPALKPFWKTKADVKVLKGGRDSSKTWDVAGFSVFLASTYKVKFLCVRQFQNRIAESVYANLCIQIERFGLQSQFDIQKTVIIHKRTGSSFHFFGINRNINEIKGFEGADVLWIEEGQDLTKTQWSIIEPTIRKEGAECWLVYNPGLITDFAETNFKHNPDNGIIVRHINYPENPFLSDTSKRRIERLKTSDYEEYEHIYLGIPRDNDDQAIIKRTWVMAAIDAHIKLGIEPTGAKRLGFDVADSGNDLCAETYVHGIVALSGSEWKGKEDELLKSCRRVYGKAIELGASIDYDSIGVGAHCGAYFQEMNEDRKTARLEGIVKYYKFIAGAKVVNPEAYYINTPDEKIKNKDFFENLVAQAWWDAADRFRNTYNAVVNGEEFPEDQLISISSDMEDLSGLVTELSTPWRAFSKTGKVKRESKEDMAKRDISSPNRADSFIQANGPRETKLMAALW